MENDKRRVVFVGGIPSSLTAETIKAHFGQFDQVANVRIVKDRFTKIHKGYAYVTLAHYRSVALILSMPHVIAGRAVDVQIASKRGEKYEWKADQMKRKLFVSNLPSHVDNESLGRFFSQAGEVRNAYVIKDFASKRSLNYGYVEFVEPDSMRRVLNAGKVLLDGVELVCLPFQGKFQEKKYQSPYPAHAKRRYAHWKNTSEQVSESMPEQYHSWNQEKVEEAKTTKINTYESFDTRSKNQYRNTKYEFIGISSRLNQEESNYQFRVKLENRPESLGGYFRVLMSVYGASNWGAPNAPRFRYTIYPQPVLCKPSLEHGLHHSETMLPNSPTGRSLARQASTS